MDFAQSPEVLFPDEFNRPRFLMGPYDNAAMVRNFALALANGPEPEIDWAAYFGPGDFCTLTRNGREAIAIALEDLDLAGDDEVLLATTSGGPYVSRCVTDAISRFCRWSWHHSDRTRAIFLIHEFGFPAQLSDALLASGLPVIEDCAYALGSQNEAGTVGRLGQYVIYSFSKALPMPYGGLLKSRRSPVRPTEMSAAAQRELPRLIAHYLPGLAASCQRRREVFRQYLSLLAADGFSPRFELGPAAAPYGFVVAMADQKKAEAMKPRINAAGITSSVFYGNGGYYLPNHQSLSDAAVEYIVANFLAAFREA
jgi:hypothetical protein